MNEEDAQRDEELSFALAFQEEMAGEDLREVPEELHEPMRKSLGLVIKRCKADVPCYVRGDGGMVCHCMVRMLKWVSFWRLVRFDQEDRLPTPLRESIDINGPVLHRPIFTFICPCCGKREDSYRHRWFGTHDGAMEPALTTAPDEEWIVCTAFTRPIDRIIGLTKSQTEMRYVCSNECGHEMQEEWSFYEPENMEKAWANIAELDGRSLRLFGRGWGVHVRRDETAYEYKARVIEAVRRMSERLIPPFDALIAPSPWESLTELTEQKMMEAFIEHLKPLEPQSYVAPKRERDDLTDAMSYAFELTKEARERMKKKAEEKRPRFTEGFRAALNFRRRGNR